MKSMITLEQFYEYIDWIEIFDALEVHLHVSNEGKIDLLIPYIMNDCVESILRINDCVFSKHIDQDTLFLNPAFLRIEESDDLFLQLKEEIVVIHYDALTLETNCYQYHEIGHQWRKKSGEEHIRRLVNLICVIHDKQRFLGDSYTNDLEREISPLIEFGPFAEWSPINTSMAEWYSETDDGIEAMKKIAWEAEDKEYHDLICKYQSMPVTSKQREMTYRILAGQLVHTDHHMIYETILNKINHASASWNLRDYGKRMNDEIEKVRKEVEKQFFNNGYSGRYPYLYKYDADDTFWKRVHFVEQHPFTILESEDYHFHIYAMESFSDNEQPACREYGFFHENMGQGRFYQVL